MATPLPFVLVNMAVTADGKIATANRRVASFGSPRDLQHLYELRATADAVLSGARTLREEDIDLDAGPARFQRLRIRRGLSPAPLRVIASASGNLPPRARVFRKPGAPVLILTTRQASPARLRKLRQLADAVLVCGTRSIDWHRALAWLAARWKVRRLLAEGGGELNGSLLRAGVIDELHLTVCPVIVGGRSAPTLADGDPVSALAQAIPFQVHSSRCVGSELYLVLRRPSNRAG